MPVLQIDNYLSEKFFDGAFLRCLDETCRRENDANRYRSRGTNESDHQFDGWNQNPNDEGRQYN